MYRQTRRSFGISAINVIAGIGVVVIIACISIPLILRSAEQQRVRACSVNLRLLGISLANYSDLQRLLPPGIIADPDETGRWQYTTLGNAGIGLGGGTSGLAMLLPFQDQTRIYDRYNFNYGCVSAENSTDVAMAVSNYVCPSNSREYLQYITGGRGYHSAVGNLAPADYVFNLGGAAYFEPPEEYTDESQRPALAQGYLQMAGPFGINSDVKREDLAKGAAYTILMGESVGGPDVMASPLSVTGGRPMTREHISVAENSGFGIDQGWSQGYITHPERPGGFGSVFAITCHDCTPDRLGQVIRPNERPKGVGRSTFTRQTDLLADSVQGFRSYHTSGMPFLFGDGTVHLLETDIDPEIYVKLSLRSGGPMPAIE